MAEVEDPASCCVDGAESSVSRAAMSKGFAMGCVLLVSVGETNVSPSLHVIRRAVCGRSPLDGGAAEGSVLEAERFAASAVGGRREGIFPRSAEEIETHGGKVSDGLHAGTIQGRQKSGGEDAEDGDVDWPDAGGRRIVVSPGFEEGLESEGVPSPFQPWILEAQSGELLADST